MKPVGGAVEQDRGNGFEVRLSDLVFSVSSALDLVCPAVHGHHLRVARIARAMARQIGLPLAQTRDILLAAALHDCGAFSIQERLDLMRFEVELPGTHAEAGQHLLRTFAYFERAAEIVRFHHLPWDHHRGELWRGRPVPLGSHLLHLADRVSVLPIDWAAAKSPGGAILRLMTEKAGSSFIPELVQVFAEVAEQPGFWEGIGLSGDDDLRCDPVLGLVMLSEADLKSLARLFWQIVDFRSRFTATHSSGVAAVTEFLAPLAGCVGAAGRRVVIAAGLHDLGKLSVPGETLEKERPLTPRERSALRDHPWHGWRVLERVPGLETINKWANYHHERLDGSGYPFQVPGAQIPLESRLVAVADVFTALTEERPYRRGQSSREAVGILRGLANSGALDHDLVAVVARHSEEAGALCRRTQERAADRYSAFCEHIPVSAVSAA